MYTKTLLDLRTSIAQLGAWENSADLTTVVLNQYVNDALEETYNITIACRDDYYTKIAPTTTLVFNQDTYALPTDFYLLRKVEIAYDSTLQRWRKLLPVPIDGANLVGQYGLTQKRYRYRLTNGGLVLLPVPQSTDTIRIYYVPLAPQLALDADTVTFDRPVEEKLVINIAMRDCYQRQDLETSAQDMLIEKYSKQLRTVADTHDDGEPFYLSRRGPSDDDGDCW